MGRNSNLAHKKSGPEKFSFARAVFGPDGESALGLLAHKTRPRTRPQPGPGPGKFHARTGPALRSSVRSFSTVGSNPTAVRVFRRNKNPSAALPETLAHSSPPPSLSSRHSGGRASERGNRRAGCGGAAVGPPRRRARPPWSGRLAAEWLRDGALLEGPSAARTTVPSTTRVPRPFFFPKPGETKAKVSATRGRSLGILPLFLAVGIFPESDQAQDRL